MNKAKARFALQEHPTLGSKEDEIFADIIAMDADLFSRDGVRAMQKVITHYVAFIHTKQCGIIKENAVFDVKQQFRRRPEDRKRMTK